MFTNQDMFKNNGICSLLNIKYPIIQGGMVWVSGAKLASAVSQAGGLGLIGAGSMNAQLLLQHIRKAKGLTKNPFGINLPLLYHGIDEQISVALEENVKIFFTSAGSPNKFTKFLKERGCTVIHVTDCVERALKCQDAGVDAVVLEGFEAGGHNSRDELTSLVLLQQAAKSNIKIPVIFAGGFASGASLLSALICGAAAVQFGSVFAASLESSAHGAFKEAMVKSADNDTFLHLKSLVPVRLLKNPFARTVKTWEERGATPTELDQLLGKGRAKKGMFEGDLLEGELEIGQIVSTIKEIKPVHKIVAEILEEFNQALLKMKTDFLTSP